MDDDETIVFDRNNNAKKEDTPIEKKTLRQMNKNYKKLKLNAIDFKSRYCGHCNVATDIKEACFIGTYESYIYSFV